MDPKKRLLVNECSGAGIAFVHRTSVGAIRRFAWQFVVARIGDGC
jgi:hypothetical protein